jgi:hypothetical protein
LQHVCARDPHGIDCSQIPELLDGLIEVQETDAEKKQFVLAKDAAAFMCDACLAPIREGVIYLEDPPSADKKKPNPTITDANAQLEPQELEGAIAHVRAAGALPEATLVLNCHLKKFQLCRSVPLNFHVAGPSR